MRQEVWCKNSFVFFPFKAACYTLFVVNFHSQKCQMRLKKEEFHTAALQIGCHKMKTTDLAVSAVTLEEPKQLENVDSTSVSDVSS